MADISNVVQVTISRETQAVTRAGFGVALVLGSTQTWTEYVRTYESLDEVLDDFTTSDNEYKAAAKYFGQELKPTQLKIGRSTTPVAEVQTLTVDEDFVTGNTIDMTIKGTAISTVSFTSDHATTMTALAAEIALSPYVDTAVVSAAREITITAQVAGVSMDIASIVIEGGASQPVAVLATTTDNSGPIEDLQAISEENDDWYGLIYTNRTAALVEEVAEYIETQRKIFGTTTSDADTLDQSATDDIGYILNAANYDRTFVCYDADVTDFFEAAWMGRMFPLDAGSATWKFKELAGITASDLTATQRSSALGKKVNIVTEIGGVDITEEGTMASGEFIDIMRGVDWLQARIEENVYSRLVNSDKIPYTDGGVGIIESELQGVLQSAIRQGILADDPAPTVTVPLVADVDQVDKANRFLPDVEFLATLAGAIHKVQIQGVVTV